ncbi:hypothetical protein B484DRAFT_400648 [Ochromonadaceae sp. CCMP2298]|nr:hypothetical protein B484DRAFT_400648 [Ochromonadaceae sp. CCMP2298]|mmetsp:Transcript_22951/g.51023  ORF Transcript_22951/g.51023 Transcript_22951/m.51023 type:complete len:157 (+) Transcript_22951:82-552(+)
MQQWMSLICMLLLACVNAHGEIGEKKACSMDMDGDLCLVDAYIGSQVIYEDEKVRVWNFTLAPGEMTSMHRHDYDYHFVAIKPTQLEVWGETGERLFDFRAEGTLGFTLEGEFLVPAKGVNLPFAVPRIHAAKNIGPEDYHEIIFESKVRATHCEL